VDLNCFVSTAVVSASVVVGDTNAGMVMTMNVSTSRDLRTRSRPLCVWSGRICEKVAVAIPELGTEDGCQAPAKTDIADALDVVRGLMGRTVGGELTGPDGFPAPADDCRDPSIEKLTRDPALCLPRPAGGLCSTMSSFTRLSEATLRTVFTEAVEMRLLRLRARATSRSSERCPWLVNWDCSEGWPKAEAAASRTGKGVKLHI
jgi:hypothetical protein